MSARSKTRCPLTGTTVFGAALATVLRDGAINARVIGVHIAHAGGIAEIHYEQGNETVVSRFHIKNPTPHKPQHVYRIGVALSSALKVIHRMLVSADTGSAQ
jgi:hypothetical protein